MLQRRSVSVSDPVARRAGPGRPAHPLSGPDVIGWGLRSSSAVAVLVLLHVAVYALSATWTFGWGALHPDMTEAWMWGKEFQLGYPKHPPFFAWAAGVWFSLLPRTDGSFYLLAAVSAAIGLAGVWRIAGRLLDPARRWAALLLLMLMPFFSIYAARYNANSALLASWPWAAYFFIRSIESRGLADAALLGALAALSLLTKYYSAVLLASFLLAALLHPMRARFFKSPAPYLAVLVCTLVLLPHMVWTIKADFPTLKYALSKTEYAPYGVRLRTAGAVLTSLANLSLAIAVFACLFWGQLRQLMVSVARAMLSPEMAWLSALTFGPVLLTLALSLLGNVRIAAPFLIPAFFMLPIFILRASAPTLSRHVLATLLRSVAAVWCAMLVIAPGLGYAVARFNWGPPAEPQRELAHAVSEIWRQRFATRLEAVAGNETYCRALTFYARDAPSFFSLAKPSSTPWISEARLKASGLLILCRDADTSCLAHLHALARAQTQKLRLTLPVRMWGYTGVHHAFTVLLVPPWPDAEN